MATVLADPFAVASVRLASFVRRLRPTNHTKSRILEQLHLCDNLYSAIMYWLTGVRCTRIRGMKINSDNLISTIENNLLCGINTDHVIGLLFSL